jgi:excisionase family DNA binding protein
MMVVVDLDGPLAAHVAAALALWRQRLRSDHLVAPAGFDELLVAATAHARPRQATPDVDEVARLAQSRPMALMLTKEATAEALTVSPRTVDRLIADGRLAAVKVGHATRVRVEDLSRYVGSLEPASPADDVSS